MYTYMYKIKHSSETHNMEYSYSKDESAFFMSPTSINIAMKNSKESL